MSNSAPKDRLLTEVELQIMTAVWDFSPPIGACTIREIHAALSEKREVAYTSVATIVKILEQKKFLTSKRAEKAHLYAPAISRADYEATTLRHVTREVFRGDSSSMVSRLLDEGELSAGELESIRALLDERLGKRKDSTRG
jgi:predicted transcriptional regulator